MLATLSRIHAVRTEHMLMFRRVLCIIWQCHACHAFTHSCCEDGTQVDVFVACRASSGSVMLATLSRIHAVRTEHMLMFRRVLCIIWQCHACRAFRFS
ncbi:hypothetical protein DUNSADRAFT_893 [Dunaliella salina]|uniref:Secreted protein n=1 Tax=Dunaliella salina TaxID=3046 RepID=A0ABQ7H8N9_DUNSA|nr:hypothetical protein DUNSADRAFT_893 [Dunaliella salina]|eukprot:KAF5843218.1 hypothetical protein DUNSADRAFT_893 [Dunaliella salina]